MIVGVLQADSVLAQFQEKHGNYPEMFRRTLGRVDPGVEFKDYNVELGEYPSNLDDCDGYVITGSKKSVYDDEPWIQHLSDFVRALHDRRKKMVGICFGHQMVAHVLGGKTEPARQGWGVGIHQYQIITKHDFMRPGADEFGLLASHKDQVTELPDGVLDWTSEQWEWAGWSIRQQASHVASVPLRWLISRWGDQLFGDDLPMSTER